MQKKTFVGIVITLLLPLSIIRINFDVTEAGYYDISSTPVGGYIPENTTWNLDGSPYVVVSDVIVEAGVMLTIEGGVDVKFTDGTNLVIDGALVAEGNATYPIMFTSNSTTPAPGNWGSIHFRDSSDDTSCVINYGIVRFATTGITIASSSPLIQHCNISDNSGYGIDDIEPAGGSPSIYGCFVTNNGIGIHIRGGGPTITENEISENVAGGILCDWAWGAQIRIERNIISSNGGYGIFCSVSGIAGGIIQIFNNTISNNTGPGIASNASDMIVIGNVISNNEYGFSCNTAVQISYNSIVENNAYDFYNSGGNELNATYNWWGTTNETLIKEHIYDYYDDYNLGKVLYDPFLVPPVAIFTFSPEIPYAFGIMTFDASASFNPYGAVINYTWDFGDSNVATTASPVITHIYKTPSNYEITLTVTDEFGLANSTTTTIEVFQDNVPPTIGTPSQSPSGTVNQGQEVKVSVEITDAGSGVKNATLLFTINNGSSWETPKPMSYNITTGYYEMTIPGQQNGTIVKYKIVAYDNAGNERINDNVGEYYVYSVIPEFSSFLILPSFMIATLLAVIVYRKKRA